MKMSKNVKKKVVTTEHRLAKLPRESWCFSANGRITDEVITSSAERAQAQRIVDLFESGREPADIIRTLGVTPQRLIKVLGLSGVGPTLMETFQKAYAEGKAERDTNTRHKIG
jgi:hypothetical protein